jgi:hypothetical protein
MTRRSPPKGGVSGAAPVCRRHFQRLPSLPAGRSRSRSRGQSAARSCCSGSVGCSPSQSTSQHTCSEREIEIENWATTQFESQRHDIFCVLYWPEEVRVDIALVVVVVAAEIALEARVAVDKVIVVCFIKTVPNWVMSASTATCIIIAPKRLKLRLSGSARKSQKRFRDTPRFKFRAVLARTQPFLSRSVEKRGDQARFKCRKMVNYYTIRSQPSDEIKQTKPRTLCQDRLRTTKQQGRLLQVGLSRACSRRRCQSPPASCSWPA